MAQDSTVSIIAEKPGLGEGVAPFATRFRASRGRLHREEESLNRTCFQRDRDRILHSVAFRRLEYKTQVFVNHEGDHYRTRLTHSLEVAQLARGIARHLGLDEDLAEAVALAHDLGHPPFGHAGEDALAECMKDFGGFDHNAQTLRVLTKLEHRYAEFDGLNLTWETLEGVVKHNGPVTGALPRALAEYVKEQDLELDTWPGPEAQVAALADDIAYCNHDIDDGLRAGLFTVAQIRQVPLVGEMFAEVEAKYPGLAESRMIHEAIRRIINRMVTDMTAETGRRLRESGLRSVEDVRALGAPIAGFSESVERSNRALKAFLMEHMYRHHRVNRMTSKARRLLRDLFALLLAEPECLPTYWRKKAGEANSRRTAEAVCDYIAGMTDRFAMREHKKLFDLESGL